ncbi:MAG: hypothetical protein HC913_18665 [Microscillaceae bacterium]|nr:hypothetical protein [Microscillaceae bacterium]
MCGINFIWDKRGQLNSLDSIEAMNEVLQSRGPDGSFVHWEKNELGQFFLGHQYLQIRDLGPESQQPFTDTHRHCFLLYNGELFASPTLSSFIPSDTAVLFQHLQNQLLHFTPSEIENALLALNGMYAFIWLDFSQKRY